MGLLANAVIVNLDADSKNLEQGFDRASKKMDEFGNKAESTGSKSGKSFVNMGDVVKGALFPLGTIMAGVGLASLKSAGEMQKMNVALETAFQGNKEEAAKASKFITDFAATTPYELAQVQGAFVKLKNMGLDPSKEAMTSYGDTASAMGKDLNDMVEAVADAATGEFERLKEFGIRSQSEGDKVKFTFKGVTTEVGKNSEEIQDYLKKLGQTNFAGGMDAQSKTLLGSLSTLTDSISLKMAEIANSSGLTQLATDAVAGLGNAINGFKLEDLKQVAPIFAGIGVAALVSIIPSTAAVTAFGVAMWAAAAPLLPFVALAALVAGSVYLIMNNWGTIGPFLEGLKNQISGFMSGVQNIWNIGWGVVSAFYNGIWDTIKAYTAAVFLTIYYLFTGQSDKIDGVWSAFGNRLNEIWSGVWTTIVGYLGGVWTQMSVEFESMKTSIFDFFTNTDFGQIGKNIIQGLINGIVSMASSLVTSITGTVQGAIDAAKNTLGIHSPSLVFKQEVGVQMMAGISEGLKVGAPDVYSTLEDKLMSLTQVNAPDYLPQVGKSYQSMLEDRSSQIEGSYNTTNNYGEKPQPKEHVFDFLDNLAVPI
jgi:hypothetical protein